jgi:glyoxylase-like metal-dependent hydrolase (beta-lactamase superfamily II)
VDLGGLVLEVIGTPGHTDEHLAYPLRDGDRTVEVFTGGSLLVGSVARTCPPKSPSREVSPRAGRVQAGGS